MSNIITLPLSTKISDHLTLGEVVKSQTAIRLGINNMPTLEHYENLKTLAQCVYEPLYREFKIKIPISSGYRSLALNKKIGGALNSDHSRGMALDLDVDGLKNITNRDIFEFIADQLIGFRQLIWEFGDNTNPAWVHVAYNPLDNKKEILQAIKLKTRTSYRKIDPKKFLKK